MQEIYGVDTPENVTFGYEVSGLGSRFLAALLDNLILFGILVALFLGLIAFLASPAGEALDETLADWLVAIYLLVTFALFWGYYIFFELIWNGQSPGKRWMGLRVIRSDGMPISLVESIIRNLVRLVDFLPLYYGLGVVVMAANSQARRLGDLAAGTLVVRERKDVTLSSLGRLAAPVAVGSPHLIAALGDPAAWPLERLTADEQHVVKAFLARRPDLLNRTPLAVVLAGRLAGRLELAVPDSPLACETFLEQVAALDVSQAGGNRP